jgi:hypothetical protein
LLVAEAREEEEAVEVRPLSEGRKEIVAVAELADDEVAVTLAVVVDEGEAEADAAAARMLLSWTLTQSMRSA